jgi:hypothetical protein
MKNDCESSQSCFLAFCCTLNAFQIEIFIITITIISIGVAYTIISYTGIMTEIPIEIAKTKDEANSKLSVDNSREKSDYIGDRSSITDNFYTFCQIYIKASLLSIIVLKAFYLLISNFLVFGSQIDEDSELLSFYFFLIVEFFTLIFMFFLLYIPGFILDFYKKYIILFIGFIILTLFNYQIYFNKLVSIYKSLLPVTIICLLDVLITLFLLVYSNSLFFRKVNRDDQIKEEHLSKYVLDNYTNNLDKDMNEAEIYRETTRVYDLYKIIEIIKKIRVARK